MTTLVLAARQLGCLPSVESAAVDYTCKGGAPDGVVDRPEEQCDDGNNIDGDGCDSGCHIECPSSGPCAGRDYQCRGGAADGTIDDDEQCDDGNGSDGDGCDLGCHIECASPWVLDATTSHCYQVIEATSSASDAAARCASLLGGSRLLTVHSQAELDTLLSKVIPGHDGPFRTAYLMNLGEISLVATKPDAVVEQAVPDGANPAREPGILARPEIDTITLECVAGCFSTLPSNGSWWSDRGRLVLDKTGVMLPVSADDTQVMAAICERAPAIATRFDDRGEPLPLRLRGSTYVFSSDEKSYAEAESDCESRQGTLLVLDGSDGSPIEAEREREDVMRYLGQLGPLVGDSIWVGLKPDVATATVSWVTGAMSERDKLPWGDNPRYYRGPDRECAQLVTTSTSYALGLLLPASCNVPRAYVCELR
ncbi:MAG: DUF4215 domain-containing protein [Polyangiaceae bacterium]